MQSPHPGDFPEDLIGAYVAQRAHVGKGTVYLYWPTKEDLLIGLIGRGFLGLIDDLIQSLTEDPGLARPSRFCPLMLKIATGKPLDAALQRHDDDLLGILARHPRSVALHDTLGPSAVLNAVLPIWCRNDLARADWDMGDQAFALHALLSGVAMSLMGPGTQSAVTAGDPYGGVERRGDSAARTRTWREGENPGLGHGHHRLSPRMSGCGTHADRPAAAPPMSSGPHHAAAHRLSAYS